MSSKRHKQLRQLARYYKISAKALIAWWYSIPANYRDWEQFESAVHQEIQRISQGS